VEAKPISVSHFLPIVSRWIAVWLIVTAPRLTHLAVEVAVFVVLVAAVELNVDALTHPDENFTKLFFLCR
jgi:hypothetical protein